MRIASYQRCIPQVDRIAKHECWHLNKHRNEIIFVAVHHETAASTGHATVKSCLDGCLYQPIQKALTVFLSACVPPWHHPPKVPQTAINSRRMYIEYIYIYFSYMHRWIDFWSYTLAIGFLHAVFLDEKSKMETIPINFTLLPRCTMVGGLA